MLNYIHCWHIYYDKFEKLHNLSYYSFQTLRTEFSKYNL